IVRAYRLQEPPLVFRVEVPFKLKSLHFPHKNAVTFAGAFAPKNKIRVNAVLLPSLNPIPAFRHVPMPPAKRSLFVKIAGKFSFLAIEIVVINRTEQAPFYRSARIAR